MQHKIYILLHKKIFIYFFCGRYTSFSTQKNIIFFLVHSPSRSRISTRCKKYFDFRSRAYFRTFSRIAPNIGNHNIKSTFFDHWILESLAIACCRKWMYKKRTKKKIFIYFSVGGGTRRCQQKKYYIFFGTHT